MGPRRSFLVYRRAGRGLVCLTQIPPSGSLWIAGGKRHVVLGETRADGPSQGHIDKRLQPFGDGKQCRVGCLRGHSNLHADSPGPSLLWSWHPQPWAPHSVPLACLSVHCAPPPPNWDFLIWTLPKAAAILRPQKAVIHVSTRGDRWLRPSALPIPWVVSAMDVISPSLPYAELWPQARRFVHVS